MGDRDHGWTTVGHRSHGQHQFGDAREWEAQLELQDRAAIAAWDGDAQWPGINKPLFDGPEAKKFDNRLVKLHDLDQGAFGKVDKVMHGSVCLARKRIPRRRGFSIEDLRQEGLTMNKLDHRHIVKLVATYAPKSGELCLLIWPAAVCNLSRLLEDLECLRLDEGDREDIVERLTALDLRDLSAIDPIAKDQSLGAISERCPFDFLRTIIGCVARAMAHCHANNVRHLDIKPSNILLRPDRVYLADFGISRDVSGQEQTTTDGLPGTERWRAPELYGDHGSSMQLSDMYSLGLVYLNIATVLYDVRLADFDEALSYPARSSREKQLQVREDKVKVHLDRLTAHALVRPPFMFTYDGQETVRPRPLTHLISRMVATNPRHRLTAAKIDEKLSMLGGINQIYHADCCRRPISWVEDKWDRKFAGLIALQKENEVQRKRIMELEGMDKTYEIRLEKQRQKHEQDISRLQTLLKNAEERCQRLEMENSDRRRSSRSSRGSHSHEVPRPVLSGGRRHAASPAVPSTPCGVGLGLITKRKSTPPRATSTGNTTNLNASSKSSQQQQQQTHHRSYSNVAKVPERPTGNMRTLQSSPAVTQSSAAKQSSASSGQRSPSIGGGVNLSGYALRSRGSGSKLPLPVTPSRSNTPILNRDQSMTDSSMASSVFSRHSLESVATPPVPESPVIPRHTSTTKDGAAKPSWGHVHDRPLSPTERPSLASVDAGERPSTPDSPMLSISPSALSSPRTLKSEVLTDGGDTGATARPVPPSLQPMKSWADVAKQDKRRQGLKNNKR
ncbi:hypothetical protein QQS21_011525 [Conoideocrella luteorostrata]|uniref:non-specific serine/threonine protein kinase n=1 Tax=Conoideocrella luteorostrata TaxID=1105319 RepID=A0AAJ0FTM8_9HYPO|nr:hypothetical protein QQS21_011525 [Conoideocrella luteorostrata]